MLIRSGPACGCHYTLPSLLHAFSRSTQHLSHTAGADASGDCSFLVADQWWWPSYCCPLLVVAVHLYLFPGHGRICGRSYWGTLWHVTEPCWRVRASVVPQPIPVHHLGLPVRPQLDAIYKVLLVTTYKVIARAIATWGLGLSFFVRPVDSDDLL